MDLVPHSFNVRRPSLVFTWDDNSERHFNSMAAHFVSADIRCTFYINPGEDCFRGMSEGYVSLSDCGFEIASHGYKHGHYSKLPIDQFHSQIQKANQSFIDCLGFPPCTFAFPNHDFDEEMLNYARKVYLETRNTLGRSIRISLKSQSQAEKIVARANEILASGQSVVFSGHSVRFADEECLSNPSPIGYEPISEDTLSTLIRFAKDQKCADVLTFEKAALKEWLKELPSNSNGVFHLTKNDLEFLSDRGIPISRLNILL